MLWRPRWVAWVVLAVAIAAVVMATAQRQVDWVVLVMAFGVGLAAAVSLLPDVLADHPDERDELEERRRARACDRRSA